MASQRGKQAALSAEERARLVEEMGLIWEQLGSPRMEGRIVGYLMLSNEPYVSTGELAEALHASAGTLSTVTRRLVEIGFIKRVPVKGERSHFFRCEDDVWGAFLGTEGKHLRRRQDFAEHALEVLGAEDDVPRLRLKNMRDYHSWLAVHHGEILNEWESFKRKRDEG
jgi:DNA-binding transcriptional regulator GbsR (MarR family)